MIEKSLPSMPILLRLIPMSYILAIDQGTTSSRVFIYNQKLERIAQGQKAFQQHFPKPTWVEHDLEEIWTSVIESLKEALASVKDPAFDVKKIVSIGITNQRETFGLWDKSTNKALAKAIVWQDKRSTDFCNKLKKTAAGKSLEKLSGLVLDPYFSGTKLSLLLKDLQQKKNIAFGTMDSFLLWRLSGGKAHATDVSNASRTLLMDLKKLAWSPEALRTLKVSSDILPEIMSSDAEFGKTLGLGILPDGIPIHGILGDQQSALFGQQCFKEGEAKITYGTGAFMLSNTGSKILRKKGSLSTVAWKQNNSVTYAVESSVFISGAAVQWLRDGLKIISQSSDVENLAKSVPSSDGVFFIPSLSGLGSPYWIPEAKGMIGGLTRGSTQAHIARACLEGIAHSVAATFESMSVDATTKKTSIRVDGGACQNNLLMQMQSDLLQKTIERPKDVETTARGAACMAALGVGLVDIKTLNEKKDVDFLFKPKLSKADSKNQKQLWDKRIKALISFSKT